MCLGQGDKDYLTLRILVENQGRLSSGPNINQERKGGPRIELQRLRHQLPIGLIPG